MSDPDGVENLLHGLVLSRKAGERVSLITSDGIRIVVGVARTGSEQCRLVFDAPQSVRILRTELEEPPAAGGDEQRAA